MKRNVWLGFLVMLVLVAGPVSEAWAQAETWEAYEINAQYRGGVKKGFDELGCGVGGYISLPDGNREIVFHACVKDPEKRQKFYGMRLRMVYSFDGKGQVKTVTEKYAWFDNFEKQHQDQIRDMILLLGTIKDGSLIQAALKQVMINATTIVLDGKTGSGGKSMELGIQRPGKPILEGKFFLKNASSAWNLTKFRMKRGKVSVSFVTNPLAQVQAEYQAKEPFSRVVFGR
ncbi:MAG: hypothetical protein GX442_02590 [Candidatus Riflebacteria bacterium]|nr:hypothetical protein [Candidatus Riflebacteria bacterium]